MQPFAYGRNGFRMSASWGRADMVLALTTVAALTLATLLGYRFAVTDRARRLLRSSFSLYLAPALIDRLIEAERIPDRGCETTTLTIRISHPNASPPSPAPPSP